MSSTADFESDGRDHELECLIDPARQGDSPAQNRMAELLRPRIRSFAAALFPNIVRPRADASDVAQDTLLEIHQTISAFRGSTAGELWAWAFWKVRAQLKDIQEKHVLAVKRSLQQQVSPADAEVALVQTAANDSSPSTVAIRNEEQADFIGQIEQLPDPEKIVMELLYVDKLAPQDVAVALTQSLAEVEKLRFKALRRLAKLAVRTPSQESQ